jgi:sec1 family domain-containing protein 1
MWCRTAYHILFLISFQPDPQKKTKRSYDLNSSDYFWAKNAPNPFPQVAEEIDAELGKYKQDAADITRSTGVSDVNDISQLYVPCYML